MPAEEASVSGATCALCSTSLGYASLLLVCDHHLCLPCSAEALENRGPSTAPVVVCRICNELTEVDDGAAKYLESLRPDSARTTASGNGGGSAGSTVTLDVGRMPSPGRHPDTLDSSSASTVEMNRMVREAPATVQEPQAQQVRPAVHQPHLASSVRQPISQDSPLSSSSGNTGGLAASLQRRAAPDRGHSQAAVIAEAAGQGKSFGGSGGKLEPAFPQFGAPLKASQSGSVCGQCEERQSEIFCEQCTESFCRPCSATVHKRGRMAQHQLRPLAESRSRACADGPIADEAPAALCKPCAAGDPSLSLSQRLSAGDNLTVLSRRFWGCPCHPDEALQFVCLSCEAQEVICAECALHGRHRGHEVQNIRDAAARLPERAAELGATLQSRSEELRCVSEHAKEGRRQISMIVSQGKRELADAFEWLRSALDEEEAAILSEVDRCSTDVSEILAAEDSKDEGSLRDASAALHDHHHSGDAIQALDIFGTVKRHCSAPLPTQHALGGDMHLQLKGQLQRGFEARIAGIGAVAASFEAIRPLELVRGQTAGAAGVGGSLSPKGA